jgi:hypothetical protein
MKKTIFFLIIMLFIAMPVLAVKYVAVVESELDEQSGASAEISRADVRLVTAELRREAVKNLPPGQYNVMTSETVIAQGSAFAVDCNEENCVIALGSKIGADYIVRGTVSKLETRLTLTVEIYETENGNLVASSDPVRAGSIGELVDKAASACAAMYMGFVATQEAVAKLKSKSEPEPPELPETSKTPELPEPPKAPEPPEAHTDAKKPSGKTSFSLGGGAFFAADLGGGLAWESSGEALAMPYYGGGAYLFFDATYAEVFAGFSTGGGKWESPASTTPDSLTDMPRSYINIGVFAKYPIDAGSINFFPLAGIDYDASISGKRKYAGGKEVELDYATSAVWLKLGAGADFALGNSAYIRVELLYGWRTANEYENEMRNRYITEYNSNADNVKTRQGNGPDLKAGFGVRF